MKAIRPFGPALALALLFPSTSAGASSFPKPDGPINDFAGVLDAPSKAALLSQVQEIKDKTGDEIFVAIVPSLQGMTVEEYSNRLFTQWGPGQKGKDNGLLVVVCPAEHKARIEVGYGLEGVITDGRAGDVIRGNFLPAFKKNQYGPGLLAGVGELSKMLENPSSAAGSPEVMDDFLNTSFQTITTLCLCLFAFFGSLFFGIGLGNKVLFPTVFGAVFAGIPLWMSLAIPVFVAAGIYVLCTESAGFVLGFWVGKGSKKGRPGKGGSVGGWTWGSGGGGSSSGSSGGSWGGGGSSGGGGASGSW